MLLSCVARARASALIGGGAALDGAAGADGAGDGAGAAAGAAGADGADGGALGAGAGIVVVKVSGWRECVGFEGA